MCDAADAHTRQLHLPSSRGSLTKQAVASERVTGVHVDAVGSLANFNSKSSPHQNNYKSWYSLAC